MDLWKNRINPTKKTIKLKKTEMKITVEVFSVVVQ